MGTSAVVILPSDGANLGKQVATITKGGIHRHLFIQDRVSTLLGVYATDLGAVQAVQASAQNGTSTGFAWFAVPNSVSGKSCRLRSLIIKENVSAVTPVMPTQPRIVLARFTFTGNPSGTQLLGTPYNSIYPASVGYLSAAVTGMTPTLVNSGAAIGTFLVPPFLLSGTAATIQQTNNEVEQLIPTGFDFEDDWNVFAPGQGAVLYQPDAGTASDIRKFVAHWVWDDIDTSGN